MKWSITALLICLLYGSTLPGNTDDWPMFQHDPQHSGYSSSPMPESLKEVWTNESHCMNTSTSGDVLCIAISENRVCVINYVCLSVLDVYTGSVIWSIQWPMVDANFPAIENDKLFLSDLSLILCFNADTGEELWKHVVRLLPFTSSPLAVDKFVIMGGGEGGLFINPTNSEIERDLARARVYARRIMCLDAETGNIVWEFYLDDLAYFSPAYFKGRVYTNDGSNHMYCLDAQTGDLIWKKRIGWENSSHLSMDGEKIFVGTTGGIICLKSETGEIIWRFECDNIISEPLAVAYNKVFAGDRKGILYGLDAKTGELIWKMETGSTISSPIIVADKKVAFGTDDGILYLVKAGSGRICESLDFDSGITGLALSDGKLFIGQENGRVSCYEGSTPKNLIPVVFILILSVVLIFISVWYQRKS
ncbi:MAG: PQQ-binding-like beta-propeller repeat protein [Theionarchaea archaeon]|nr:PQQ-binding-like beta-propeller repeat protein [Theionarchaea archaeon]